MRQPAGEPAEQYAEGRDFASCRRRGSLRRDEPWEAGERRADDDEEQDGRYQPGGRGTEERVEEAVHRVFSVD